MQPPNPNLQGEMQDKLEKSARWNVTQANKADFELCSNLMLLDTVALTVTVILLANGDSALKKIGIGGAIILIITSICVVFSIFCGIANYIMIRQFQMQWSTAKSRAASRFASNPPLRPDQMELILAEEQSNRPQKSNPVFWYGQIIFLSIAIILYLVIIIITLSSRL